MDLSGSRDPSFKRYALKDNIGVVVYCDKEEDFDEKALLANNYGVRHTQTVVKAASAQEAIRRFYDSCEGARFGGPERKAKAIHIDISRTIVRLPYCRLISRDEKNHKFFCGPDAIFGMCVIGGATDLPDGKCPMRRFCNINSYGFYRALPKEYSYRQVNVEGVIYSVAEPAPLPA
jgi:hypothetical protein